MKLATFKGIVKENGLPVQMDGACHHCRVKVAVKGVEIKGGITIKGGAVYEVDNGGIYMKCPKCYKLKPTLVRGLKTEVYPRTIKAKTASKPKSKNVKKSGKK